jgi:diguanylate cyclase (GGDEF)-like protein
VLLLELDRFEEVTDARGRRAGDLVLQAVAARLRQGCREYDYVARTGASAFAVVLPETRPEAAARRLEQLLAACTEGARQWHADLAIAIRAGQAFYPQDGFSAEQLLAAAEQRLPGAQVYSDVGA